ncbi:unnamed protein product [Lupinus luteus]|uniref:Uncharacterized protein n=1 Tax=Lupinus luteus TaxID=3873 RepID=A0AAV1WJ10_LUPLU
MHVTRSSKGCNMVNPLIIGSCDQKEAINSGSEIGADNSGSFAMTMIIGVKRCIRQNS